MPDLLLKSETVFKQAAEAVLVSRNGIVRYMNPSAVKLLGEHTGSRVSDMLGSAVSEMPDGATASTWSAGRQVSVRAAVHEDVSIYYVTAVEEPSRFSTHELALQSRLRDTLSSLDSLSRTLLVKLYDDYQDSGEQGAYRGELASAVLHCSSRLNRAFMGRMELDDLQSGRTKPDVRCLDAGRFCRELAGTVSYFAKPRGINVVFEGDPDADGTFDGQLVETAMLHMISNSLMNMTSGCTLTLSAECSGGYTILGVDDDGSGLSDESKLHAYDRGNLGLRYVGVVTALHKGSFLMEGRVGYGTHMRMVLPYVPERHGELNTKPVKIRRNDMAYILTQLSPWLDSSDYDPRLLD